MFNGAASWRQWRGDLPQQYKDPAEALISPEHLPGQNPIDSLGSVARTSLFSPLSLHQRAAL